MANTTNTQEQQEKAIPRHIIVLALILVLGAIPPMLDTTIVNIAVNDLSRQFNVPFVVTQWVVTGYVLALGIAVPFSGWLVQKFDGKRIFMGALGPVPGRFASVWPVMEHREPDCVSRGPGLRVWPADSHADDAARAARGQR